LSSLLLGACSLPLAACSLGLAAPASASVELKFCLLFVRVVYSLIFFFRLFVYLSHFLLIFFYQPNNFF
jgi:hypothetical protein